MSATPATISELDLGGISLTFLPDGELRADPAVAYPAGDDELFTDGLDVVDEDGMLVLSVGAILITAGERRVLIDAGIGGRTIPLIRPGAKRDGFMGGGALLQSLRASGVAPEEIDAVLITHLHADHVGWIADEHGDAIFPNADYWVAEAEWGFWNRPEHRGDAIGPRPRELAVIGARRRALDDGAEPVPGVTAVATAGHTPGHLAFAVQGTDGRAVVIGDALHCPAEALRPDLMWVGDVDGAAAVRTRRDLMSEVARTGAVLVGPHFPDAVFLDYTAGGAPTLVAHAARADA